MHKYVCKCVQLWEVCYVNTSSPAVEISSNTKEQHLRFDAASAIEDGVDLIKIERCEYWILHIFPFSLSFILCILLYISVTSSLLHILAPSLLFHFLTLSPALTPTVKSSLFHYFSLSHFYPISYNTPFLSFPHSFAFSFSHCIAPSLSILTHYVHPIFHPLTFSHSLFF